MELREIRQKLPFGAMVEIARRLGIKPYEVTQVFAGIKTKHWAAIIDMAAQIITERLEVERKAAAKLSGAIENLSAHNLFTGLN